VAELRRCWPECRADVVMMLAADLRRAKGDDFAALAADLAPLVADLEAPDPDISKGVAR
jgi:hypothetical protein